MILSILSRHRNIVVGLATFIAAVYMTGVSEPAVSSDSREAPIKRVETGRVDSASSQRDLRFSGVTRAVERARLAFSLGGRIVARPVEVGDVVAKGSVLARLDGLEVENAVAGAQGALAELQARRAQAERDAERARKLLAAKAATAEEVEKVEAGLQALRAGEDAATARLREAERLRDETRLKAPFSGTVTEVFFEPGEFVSPGRPVLVLSGDGDLEVEVEVPESVVPRVAEGDSVSVVLPHQGPEPFDATVESVGRTAAGAGRLFPVVARLASDPRLVVGATAELRISLTSDQAIAVPVEAVINPGGRQPALFKVVEAEGGHRVEKVRLEVGALIGDAVVVEGDLSPGDRVVVGGQRGLLDGEPVEPVDGSAEGER